MKTAMTLMPLGVGQQEGGTRNSWSCDKKALFLAPKYFTEINLLT